MLANSAVILVVDDEPKVESMFNLRFRKQIASGEFLMQYARSGQEALEILEANPAVDIVLLDINMPEMDGLTLLPRLIELDKTLRVVMVSAYGDMRNIRKAMNLGAFDFVTKPIDFKDLETTIAKTLDQVELGKRARVTKELEEKNKALRELDQWKSRLFTDISHEFRTPLTAILGTTDQIKRDPGHWLKPGLPIIERNGRHLLDLVNQVLDLRKLESGKLEIRPVRSDFIGFLDYLLESYHPLLDDKNIQLDLQSTVDALITDFDPDKVTSIISNLLSNAVKYTPRGGTVVLRVEAAEKGLLIEIRDSGVGIAPEDLLQIFDRFFQVPTRPASPPKAEPTPEETGKTPNIPMSGGTGIGLALTKELVELMGGTISVESEVGTGSTFKIFLPLEPAVADGREPQDQEWAFNSPQQPVPDLTGAAEYVLTEERPTLLIVEDNIDVATYLKACLEEKYLIQLAWNGQEGIDYAIDQVPDIIISDVMMPEKDGYELCRRLKNDRRTSHIPIVLLTAKADTDSRIEGLERGADAYLAKPFNQQELLVQLANLLEIRKKLQAHYRSLDSLPAVGDSFPNLEDEFLASVRQAIETNLDDEQFRIPELCKTIGVSRTQLHRKVKALTNLSTTHFIRNIRLQKARALLRTTDLNITQVAFEVGFSDPRYFSRTFQELFGHTPSAMRG